MGCYFGVRAGVDIPVGENGNVEHSTEGMSVVPPPITNLAPHRLPRKHGGRSKDPTFDLETDELSAKLRYRPDPEAPERHGVIEPAPDAFRRVSSSPHRIRTMWRRATMASVMEQAKEPVAPERVAAIALAEPYARALLTIRVYAAGLLNGGCPREHSTRTSSAPAACWSGASEEAEDVVLDVMDFLAGFSSIHMKL